MFLLEIHRTSFYFLELKLSQVDNLVLLDWSKSITLLLCSKHGDIARRTAAVFYKYHSEKNVDHSYVIKLVKNFMEIASVQNRKCQRGISVVTGANKIWVLGEIAIIPEQ